MRAELRSFLPMASSVQRSHSCSSVSLGSLARGVSFLPSFLFLSYAAISGQAAIQIFKNGVAKFEPHLSTFHLKTVLNCDRTQPCSLLTLRFILPFKPLRKVDSNAQFLRQRGQVLSCSATCLPHCTCDFGVRDPGRRLLRESTYL